MISKRNPQNINANEKTLIRLDFSRKFVKESLIEKNYMNNVSGLWAEIRFGAYSRAVRCLLCRSVIRFKFIAPLRAMSGLVELPFSGLYFNYSCQRAAWSLTHPDNYCNKWCAVWCVYVSTSVCTVCQSWWSGCSTFTHLLNRMQRSVWAPKALCQINPSLFCWGLACTLFLDGIKMKVIDSIFFTVEMLSPLTLRWKNTVK